MPGVGDFYAGLLHPVITIEGLLPLIALGLLAGRQVRSVVLAMLASLSVGLLAGATCGLVWPFPHAGEVIGLAAATLLGLAVAIASPLPLPVAVMLTWVPAVALGWANGAEADASMSAYRFIPGIVLGGVIVLLCGMAATRQLRAPWMVMAVRVVGSWIAAAGVLRLALA